MSFDLGLSRAAWPLYLLAMAGLVTVGCGGGGGADAGVDSGVDSSVDTAVDTGPAECAVAADCDDGVFCNGSELCDPTAADADELGCTPSPGDPCLEGQTCSEDRGRCETLCDITPDADGDGVNAFECGGDDCDDADGNRFPDNFEVCDIGGHDEDCDDSTLGGLDFDGDGFEDEACCNPRPDGILLCGQDCNDVDRNASPDDGEVCDGVDNDCDGLIDEGVMVDGFVDADRDLHGDGTMPLRACPGTPGHSVVGDDCDDTVASVHGAQPELCNGRDDDCDGEVDEDAAPVLWFRDTDGDGFGSAASGTSSSCTPLPGHSLLGSDCDDGDAAVHPGADELCNAVDDNCNGVADFMVAPGDFEDDDGDGAADAMCATGATPADCDDLDPRVSPRLSEVVDGVDNDCDGAIDDRCEMTDWYLDLDGDGYGDDDDTIRSCDVQEGRVLLGGDDDDSQGEQNPDVRETCNGVDDDGDGTIDELTDALCVFDHALGVCVDGVCELTICERGFTDCNATGSDGCEVQTDVDPLNCGACDTVCAAGDRSRAICLGGACTLDCDAGFSDCDGLSSSGCEVETAADPLNCGTCDLVCDVRPDSSRTCTSGACGISCDPGFTDCNAMLGDGCEVQIGRDPANCGSCGRACSLATDICVTGACIVPPFPVDGTVDFMPTGDTVLTSGRHSFRRIVIPAGVRVTASGSGVLELFASEDVVVDGTIVMSGSRGGNGPNLRAAGGGATGNPDTPGGEAPHPSAIICNPPGGGGLGPKGGRASGTTGSCGDGGEFGGGAASRGLGGGGGGGLAGGGGGGHGAGGLGGDGAGTDGGGGGAVATGGAGGVAASAYGGTTGSSVTNGAGGGGSIGSAAVTDLRVLTSFGPGSGGGAGAGSGSAPAGGGGGGGGALRISSPTSITIGGALRANGGRGGNAQNSGGPGGGGSGGVIFLSAPTVTLGGTSTIEAVGGLGGTGTGGRGGSGGLGRIRLSVVASECTIVGATNPPTTCSSADTAEEGHVGAYPD